MMDLPDYSATETLRDGRFASGAGLEKETDYFLGIDFFNQVALVAVANDANQPTIVGGGRYVVVQRGQAESRSHPVTHKTSQVESDSLLETRCGRSEPLSTSSAIITAVARMLHASIVITHQTKGISRQFDAEYSRYSTKVSRKSFSS